MLTSKNLMIILGNMRIKWPKLCYISGLFSYPGYQGQCGFLPVHPNTGGGSIQSLFMATNLSIPIHEVKFLIRIRMDPRRFGLPRSGYGSNSNEIYENDK
jgi:hypothetical protein